MWLILVIIMCGVLLLLMCFIFGGGFVVFGFFVSRCVRLSISNGVRVIDRVMESISRLCRLFWNRFWLWVILNMMKVNLLLVVRIMFRCSVEVLLRLLEMCLMKYSIGVFRVISSMVRLSIIYGDLSSRLMFVFIFMLMKNRLSNRFLNGLICVFSLWWYFELVSSRLVRKVLRVMDMLVSFISSVVFIIISSVVVVDMFCSLVWVMMWNIGCSRQWLLIIIVVMLLIILRVWVSLLLLVLLCVLLSSGIMVISGIVVMFWNSRMVKVRWLWGCVSFLCLVRICRLKVVDDSVRFRLSIIVLFIGWLKLIRVIVLIIRLVSSICSRLMLNIDLCIIYRCCGDSFRLMMNSSNIMFILEICVMFFGLFIRFSMLGLISMLVSRQLSIVFSCRCLVSGIMNIVVIRKIMLDWRKLFLCFMFNFCWWCWC